MGKIPFKNLFIFSPSQLGGTEFFPDRIFPGQSFFLDRVHPGMFELKVFFFLFGGLGRVVWQTVKVVFVRPSQLVLILDCW
jgi:hypothetical protein